MLNFLVYLADDGGEIVVEVFALFRQAQDPAAAVCLAGAAGDEPLLLEPVDDAVDRGGAHHQVLLEHLLRHVARLAVQVRQRSALHGRDVERRSRRTIRRQA